MIIDVSSYQGSNIDWGQVRGAAEGAYIKITEGGGYVNPSWSDQYNGAGTAGLARGAYHFADLGNPVTEANHFADVLMVHTWQLLPVLDLETNGANLAGWVNAFRAQVRARTGRSWFRVYSDRAMLTSDLDPAGWMDGTTSIWAAAYGSSLGWDHAGLELWQNTSGGHVPGLVGNVDEDQYLHGWTPATDAGRMGIAVPTPAPNPTPHPVTGKLPANTYLRQGSTGAAVVALQRTLNAQYPLYSHLVVDGVFGPATAGVVREFQSRAHLQVDGIAGPQTLHALGLV